MFIFDEFAVGADGHLVDGAREKHLVCSLVQFEAFAAQSEVIPNEHRAEMAEAECPPGDEVGCEDDDERPECAQPGIDPGSCGHRRQQREPGGLERGVHSGERAENDQDINRVAQQENEEEDEDGNEIEMDPVNLATLRGLIE